MNKILKLTNKFNLASYNEDEQKKIRTNQLLSKLLIVAGYIVSISLLVILFSLIRLIPTPEKVLFGILYVIAFVALGLLIIVISSLIFIPISKLLDKLNYNIPTYNREHIASACSDIRKYYGLDNDYLLTKCFKSTNNNFNNHDICIFRVYNEIRITNDIVRGYLKTTSNLGCYSVKFDELEVYKDDYNNKRVTVLKFGNEEFVIGIKAYSYITKLLNVKVYKNNKICLELDDLSLSYIYGKGNLNILYEDIDSCEISIPKYDGIPGSLYDHSYNFKIITKNKNKYYLSIILERLEEKEIINFLNDKKVKLNYKYIDNRNNGI
jgi:hypothetical protein